jgi:transporter family-2 protein
MNSLAAVGIGVIISFMLTANGLLQGSVGPWNALLVVHAAGLLSVLAILLVRRQGIGLSALRATPWYLFCAGFLGIALLFINNRTFQSLGVTLTVALGIFGQLVASGVIDHFGLFGLERRPFRPAKLGGNLLIVLGIVLMSLNWRS